MGPTARISETRRFANRRDVGAQLGERLSDYRRRHPIVVGVGPDGVAVAAEVARAMGAMLEAIAVEPLGLGDRERDRFGTAAEGGVTLFDRARVGLVDSQFETVDGLVQATQQRLDARTNTWHGGTARVSLTRREVLLIIDALVDAELMAAAACVVRNRGASRVTVAAPFARMAAASALVDWADEVVCLTTIGEDLSPAGCFGEEAPPTDDEIHKLLVSNRLDRHLSEPQRGAKNRSRGPQEAQ